MARSKNKRSKKSKPAKQGGKRGKKKYGVRAPVTPAKAKRKPAAKKKTTRKNAAKQGKKVAKKTGPSQAEQRWDANYARAAKLHASGDPLWWYKMTGKDKSFGTWMQTQRYNRNIGRLRPDREARLEKIDFVWDTIEAAWEMRFEQFEQRIRSGDDDWWGELVKQDPKLEAWCRTQRHAYHAGTLAEERIARLEAIGFVWSQLDELWERRFGELRKALKKIPNGRIVEDNAPQELAMWARTQRRKFRAGQLSEERRQRLDEIGFCWDVRQAKSDERWEQHFSDLAAYAELTGDGNPGPDDDPDTFRWLVAQRRAWDTMPPERRARLVKLRVSRTTPPDQLTPRSADYVPDWDGFFAKAAAFKKRFGHLRIGHDEQSAEFPGLLGFAAKLRSGKLEPDAKQRARLERMGFVWDLLAARVAEFFETRFAELVKYKKKHGDCNVSQLSKTHRALGQWVNRLRQMRDELEPEQRQRLDALGFVWQLKKEWMEGQWETRFAELLEYKKQNGDCLVPQPSDEWPTLCRWVGRMRTTKDQLSKERVKRLDAVGFVWNAKAAERAETEAARYRELAAFVKKHGHARVTRGNDPTAGPLNAWIVRQREKKKKGKMDAELEKRLDALGFVWVTR